MVMEKKPVTVIGVPMDLGAGRRGVDMGPSAIRYAMLKEKLIQLGYEVEDVGNLHVPTPETHQVVDPRLKYLKEIASVCETLGRTVSETVERGRFPLVLGGDHSIAIGTIAGAAKHRKRLGLIWFDAHGDLNTRETTPSMRATSQCSSVSATRRPEAHAARSSQTSLPRRSYRTGRNRLAPLARRFVIAPSSGLPNSTRRDCGASRSGPRHRGPCRSGPSGGPSDRRDSDREAT